MIAEQTISDLTQTVYDSVVGFEKAEKKASSNHVRKTLSEMRARREQSRDDLNRALVDLEQPTINATSLKSDMHRTWMDITALVEAGDKAAIERVEGGESYLRNQIEAAIEECDEEDEALHALLKRVHDEAIGTADMVHRLEQQIENR